MEIIQVHASEHDYSVYVGEHLRFNLSDYFPQTYSALLIVTDTHVAQYYLNDVIDRLKSYSVSYIVVTPGEQTKNIDMFYQLHTKAYEAGLDRNSAMIALGGGMIGDLTGLAAATYMRGIDYIQVPTSILAHDSSIGGKVAINHDQAKNLIGAFHPPAAVVYDVETLDTLDSRQIRSGYGELIKEAFIADPVFLDELLNINIKQLNRHAIIDHLSRGMSIKQTIVEQDEYETGNRAFLNLGHTLGHAIEKESGYGLSTHGEAIALGTLFALHISQAKGWKSLPFNRYMAWLYNNHYSLTLPHQDTKRYLRVMKRDKKTTQSVITMVLLKASGKPVVQELSDEELTTYFQTFYTRLSTSTEN